MRRPTPERPTPEQMEAFRARMREFGSMPEAEQDAILAAFLSIGDPKLTDITLDWMQEVHRMRRLRRTMAEVSGD